MGGTTCDDPQRQPSGKGFTIGHKTKLDYGSKEKQRREGSEDHEGKQL